MAPPLFCEATQQQESVAAALFGLFLFFAEHLLAALRTDMTAGAAALISNTKGGDSVMAGSAVFTFREVGHREIACGLGSTPHLLKEAVVAVSALESSTFNVKPMAEKGGHVRRHG